MKILTRRLGVKFSSKPVGRTGGVSGVGVWKCMVSRKSGNEIYYIQKAFI